MLVWEVCATTWTVLWTLLGGFCSVYNHKTVGSSWFSIAKSLQLLWFCFTIYNHSILQRNDFQQESNQAFRYKDLSKKAPLILRKKLPRRPKNFHPVEQYLWNVEALLSWSDHLFAIAQRCQALTFENNFLFIKLFPLCVYQISLNENNVG